MTDESRGNDNRRQSFNFEYLRERFPDLAEYGALAEQLLDADPESCGVKLRRFVEALVDEIYASPPKLPRPDSTDLNDLLLFPNFQKRVRERAVLSDMHSIRSGVGKKGAHHGYHVDRNAALDGLRTAHRIGQWFARWSGVNDSASPFLTPPPGGRAGVSNAEHKRKAREANEKLNRVLAESSLLTPLSVDRPSKAELTAGAEAIENYHASLIDSLNRRSSEFVEIGARAESLWSLGDPAKRLGVIGGPGVGKSWRVRRSAASLAASATVLFVEAKYFDGNVDRWLDSSVAAHSPRGAAHLVRVSLQLERPIVVFIDGVDEAATAQRDRLAETAEGLIQRHSATVICVARRADQLPAGWSESVVGCPPWTSQELRSLADALCPTALPPAVFRILRTPFDVANAAQAVALLAKPRPGAFELIEQVVELAFSPANRLGGVSLARQLERIMRQELRSALPAGTVMRELATYAAREGIKLAALEELRDARFLDFAQGFVSFNHPNVQSFFHVTDVLSVEKDLQRFAEDNPDAARLLLSAPISDDAVRSILAALGIKSGFSAHGRYRSDAIADALNGVFGERISGLVNSDLAACWSVESTRLSGIRCATVNDRGYGPAFLATRELSRYEKVLFTHLATRAFAEPMRSSASALLDATIDIAMRAAQQQASASGVSLKDRSIRERVVWNFLTVEATASAAGRLCGPVRSGLTQVDLPSSEVEGLIADLGTKGVGSFYWLLVLLQRVKGPCPALSAALPSILRATRQWSDSQLTFVALDLVCDVAPSAPEEHRSAIRAELDQFSTENIMINSSLMEALHAAGEHFPISTEDIAMRLREVLAAPDDADQQCRAAGLFSAQFEDIVGNAHTHAIDALSCGERVRFLAMAALSEPRLGMFLPSLLMSLLECEEAATEPLARTALERCAVVIDLTDSFISDALTASAIANFGLASLGFAPVRPSGPVSAQEEVSYLVAELHFQSAIHAPDRSRVEAIWGRLSSLVTEAVAFVCFDYGNLLGVLPDGKRVRRFHDAYPEELRRFLHLALEKREEIIPRLPFFGGAVQRVVNMLGAVGNETTRSKLLRLKDEPELSGHVRSSILAIDARGSAS